MQMRTKVVILECLLRTIWYSHVILSCDSHVEAGVVAEATTPMCQTLPSPLLGFFLALESISCIGSVSEGCRHPHHHLSLRKNNVQRFFFLAGAGMGMSSIETSASTLESLTKESCSIQSTMGRVLRLTLLSRLLSNELSLQRSSCQDLKHIGECAMCRFSAVSVGFL